MELKRMKALFLCIFFLLFLSVDSVAFFSPSTLTMIAASVGSVIKQSLIIMITAVISLIIGVSRFKKKKFVLLAVSIIVFLSVLILLLKTYHEIKMLNEPDNPVNPVGYTIYLNTSERLRYAYENRDPSILTSPTDLECLKDKDVRSEVICIYKKDLADAKTGFTQPKEISFNDLSEEEYNQFVVIAVEYHPDMTPKDAVLVENYLDLILYPERMASLLDKYKDEKILFVCNGGKSSSLAAQLCVMYGNECYYSKILFAKDDRFIDVAFYKDYSEKNAILVRPFKLSDRPRIFISFHHSNSEIRKLNDTFWPLDLLEYRLIREMIDQYPHYKEELSARLSSSQVLCTSDLNCLLTQHFINYIGSSNKEIFKVDIVS